MAKYIMTCKLNFYNSKKAGKLALVTMDNGENYTKPNTWSKEAMDSLNQVLDIVEKDPDVKGWLLTGKPFFFNAGADIMSIDPNIDREGALALPRMGHSTFKRIMELKIPTVAAINGAAMGGGTEVALAHDYRTISKSPGGCDHFALPECFINLIPGWGGTQIVPRIAGVQAAVDLIIKNPLNQNRMMKSLQVFEMGLADKLFEPVEFFDESIKFLEDIITGEGKIEKKAADPKMSDEFYNETKAFIQSKVHSGAIAPYRALDLIKGAASWSLDEGFAQEDEALADMAMSPQFLASVYSFNLVQRRAKKLPGRPADVKGNKIGKIGIIGAGLMASQMALLFAQRYKVPIIMKDIKQEFVDKGLDYIRGELAKLAKKGRLTESDAKWIGNDLVKGTVTYDGFEECDFVIEAVFEEMGIKQKVFGDLEEVCKPECLFLTNTSSLNITEMAEKLKDPSRVVGFHFFNPIAILPLIEVISADKTSDVALATAFDIAKRIKKTPVLVKNASGFLVNRILLAMTDAVLKCVDEGAEFAQVDEAVVDIGFPMPPFALAALVGPAIMLHVQETLNAAWPDRFPICEGLKNMVAKKKANIYTFTDKGTIEVDPEVLEVWPQGSKKFTDQEIRDRVLERVAQEIDIMLKEGIVASPKDVDTGMIMGAGWPFFMGGITLHLDQKGYSDKVVGKKFHGADLLEA
ncbi:MAG: 3-hydroxyacyl-CoA dehydrogenase [Desulfobacterales bacterium]|nr:3-hydroxyacyl-CoA dehydrogenase [Desulfobacterales bacterium]